MNKKEILDGLLLTVEIIMRHKRAMEIDPHEYEALKAFSDQLAVKLGYKGVS